LKATAEGKPNTDLIPTPLIINRYFAAERDAIEKLEAERDEISRQMEEMDEEHGGEDGLLFEAKTEKGKLTKVSVNIRLKEINQDKDADDERKALEAYLALIEKEAGASKKVKEAQRALDAKVVAKYAKLSEAEIKTLVVDDKWLARLAADVQTELDRVSQAFDRALSNWRNATPPPRSWPRSETLSVRADEAPKEDGIAGTEAGI
jgi:type I restriction enzyme M protein